MDLQDVERILIKLEEDPTVLSDCVLLLGKTILEQNVILSLTGDTDFIQRELEVIDAGKHSIVLLKTTVNSLDELEEQVKIALSKREKT